MKIQSLVSESMYFLLIIRVHCTYYTICVSRSSCRTFEFKLASISVLSPATLYLVLIYLLVFWMRTEFWANGCAQLIIYGNLLRREIECIKSPLCMLNCLASEQWILRSMRIIIRLWFIVIYTKWMTRKVSVWIHGDSVFIYLVFV